MIVHNPEIFGIPYQRSNTLSSTPSIWLVGSNQRKIEMKKGIHFLVIDIHILKATYITIIASFRNRARHKQLLEIPCFQLDQREHCVGIFPRSKYHSMHLWMNWKRRCLHLIGQTRMRTAHSTCTQVEMLLFACTTTTVNINSCLNREILFQWNALLLGYCTVWKSQ